VAIAVDGDGGWDDGAAPAARNLNPIVVAAARDRRHEILNVRGGEGEGGGNQRVLSRVHVPLHRTSLLPGPPPPPRLLVLSDGGSGLCCGLLCDAQAGNVDARVCCGERIWQCPGVEPAGAFTAAARTDCAA